MSFQDVAVSVGFVAGACVIAWLYSRTKRGRSVSQDRRRNKQLSLLWWRDTVFLRRHWPFIVLIVAYTLAFGMLAVSV